MALYPPDDPYLFIITIWGLTLTVRWYGVIITAGALLAAYFSTHRAVARGYDPDHVWNQLMLGLILGIVGARTYYVIFEWERFAGQPWSAFNLTTGGLAIHGAIIGALLSVVIYTRWKRLPFWDWIDVAVPGFMLGQAIGRWGNFFNQEAYGRPTDLPIGLRIDPAHRVPPYTDLHQYPLDTLFHATFLYESLWNLAGFGLLLFADRHFGHGAPVERRRLRPGDLLFLYGIIYSIGRFWIEGLRTDSLCLNGIGGDCAGSLRVAQLVSLIIIGISVAGLIVNHRHPPKTVQTDSPDRRADKPSGAPSAS